MLELWIKEPPAKAISFDKGETWEITELPFFPFHIPKDVSYFAEKKLITEEEMRERLE